MDRISSRKFVVALAAALTATLFATNADAKVKGCRHQCAAVCCDAPACCSPCPEFLPHVGVGQYTCLAFPHVDQFTCGSNFAWVRFWVKGKVVAVLTDSAPIYHAWTRTLIVRGVVQPQGNDHGVAEAYVTMSLMHIDPAPPSNTPWQGHMKVHLHY